MSASPTSAFSNAYHSSPSADSSLPAFPISLTPLKGRLSPVVATLERALGAYDDYEGESLVPRISSIIELIFAITDSFSPDLIPEAWKAKFKAIEHLVIPRSLSKIPIIFLRESTQRDLLTCFPGLAPLFRNVRLIPVMGPTAQSTTSEEKKS